jgi:hypothetical protein
MRCVDGPISDCRETHIAANTVLTAGQIVSVKMETMLSNTSVVVKNRTLNLHRVYV